MKKVVFSFALAALCSATMFAQAAKPTRLHPHEIQQKAANEAAQFVARYNLDAKQAEIVQATHYAMIEKITSTIDEKGNSDAATITLIKNSCIDNMARCMTTAQRKKLIADYQAGMYN